MNKTLALIAALGLVVSAPAFAADEAAAPAPAAASDAAAPTSVKADAKTDAKKEKIASNKKKDPKAASDLAPARRR